METIEFNSSTPLYQQIHDILMHQIENGTYKPGEKIPSEEQLCNTYHISRVTVRGALKRLVDEKVLTKIHGKGTFVSNHAFVESRAAKGSFTYSCQLIGAVPSTKVIDKQIERVSGWIAPILRIDEEKNVICMKRLRMADGIPVIFEIDYFPQEHMYMLEVDMETVPVRETILKNTGYKIARYVDTFEVHFASKEEGKWLLCPPNTALLGISQTVYGEQDRVLYYNEQFIRSDLYKYVSGE